jgi:hypothetical protein
MLVPKVPIVVARVPERAGSLETTMAAILSPACVASSEVPIFPLIIGATANIATVCKFDAVIEMPFVFMDFRTVSI